MTFSDSSKPIQALKDFNMRASRDEVVAIVGASGCGKSTLLRILAGLLAPTEGSVTVGGMTPTDYRNKGGIAFIFQKPLLFPWRTVIQNVLLGCELRKEQSASESGCDEARRLLGLMGLSGYDDVYPRALSGGMLQRAAVVRALLVRPELLLMDEPFSALDEITREQLWSDFIDIRGREGFSAVLVTHSIREAAFLGERVLVMSERPGNVKAEVKVTLPHPRERSMASTQEFIRICEEIREHLA